MAIRSLKSGSFSRSVQVGNAIILPGDYESIATVTVGAGGSSSITFSSIPGTYKHLQVRLFLRDTYSNNNGTCYIGVNSAASSNFARHRLYGDGASVTAAGNAANSTPLAAFIAGATSTASTFSPIVIDFLDYADTNKYKTIRSLGGYDANGNGIVGLFSSLYMSTTAISSLQFSADVNFAQYSTAALYGIRG